MQKADEYYGIANDLFSSSQSHAWDECARHVMPELLETSTLNESDDSGFKRRICARARTNVRKLASAHLNFITPRGINWFRYSKEGEVSDDNRNWYAEATQIAQSEIESSNFYAALIPVIVDRIVSGTGLMLCELDQRSGSLVFRHIPAGTYALAENEYNEVNMVARRFKFTARQAANVFGEDRLSSSLLRDLNDPVRQFTEKHEIWHLTIPRNDYDLGNKDLPPELRRWASVYIDPGSKAILSVDGYFEFPYMATRFIKYGSNVYGESALLPIVDAIKDCVSMDESVKSMAQLAAFPRVLSTPSLADEIQLQAGGITLLRPEDLQSGLPKEWASIQDFPSSIRLLEMYKEEIDDALFISVLQVISQVDRQMTATEVQSREAEKIMTFTQSFTQFVCDMRPLMNRIFCLLARSGKFSEEDRPENVFLQIDDVHEKILSPDVSYIGKMAKALERGKMGGLLESIQRGIELASQTGNPEWMDIFKADQAMRFICDEGNVPSRCLRKAKELDALKKEREEAAIQQQQAQIEATMATANRDNAGALNQLSPAK